MKIEVDQSGKIEETAKRTVIGDSLGNTVVVRSADKRSIQELYRLSGQPRKFVIHLFSVLLSILIAKSFTLTKTYIIDTEYPGKEDEISLLVCEFCAKNGVILSSSQLQFRRIGKSSEAHKTSHKKFTSKYLRDYLSITEILKYLLPQKRTE
jgi:hypothetical protein